MYIENTFYEHKFPSGGWAPEGGVTVFTDADKKEYTNVPMRDSSVKDPCFTIESMPARTFAADLAQVELTDSYSSSNPGVTVSDKPSLQHRKPGGVVVPRGIFKKLQRSPVGLWGEKITVAFPISKDEKTWAEAAQSTDVFGQLVEEAMVLRRMGVSPWISIHQHYARNCWYVRKQSR